MTYTVKWSGKFKKKYKLMQKRGLDIDLLKNIINKLRSGLPLDEKYADYDLKGKWNGLENVTFNRTGY